MSSMNNGLIAFRRGTRRAGGSRLHGSLEELESSLALSHPSGSEIANMPFGWLQRIKILLNCEAGLDICEVAEL